MLTQGEKQKLADLLEIIMADNEYQDRVNKINSETVARTEIMLAQLIACNRAIASIFAAIKCLPKGPSVPGWLLSCLPGLWEVSKAYRHQIYSSMLCIEPIRLSWSSTIKETMF